MEGRPAMPAFDTHKAVKALTSAGFDDGQAEAVVEQINGAITENLATKADLDQQERSLRQTISGLATKEELCETIAPPATKEELSRFAAQDDLSLLATKEDFRQFELRINAKFEELTGKIPKYVAGAVVLTVALIKGLDFLLG